MKLGTATQKYERVKVQNDIRMSKHIYKLVMCLSTMAKACLVKTTVLLLHNLYFSLIHAKNSIIAVEANTNNKLHSYLSNGNFCSIKLEQF